MTILTVLFSLAATVLRSRREEKALNHAQQAATAQQAMQAMIAEVDKAGAALLPMLNDNWLNERRVHSRLSQIPLPTGCLVFIYDVGGLTYWSGNSTWIHPERLQQARDGELNLLGNGWYYLRKYTAHGRDLVTILPVQYQYLLQNQYLVNNFNAELSLPSGTRLYTQATPATWAISDIHNRYLFSLAFPGTPEEIQGGCLEQWLYGLAICFLLFLSADTLVQLARKGSLKGFLLLLVLALGRWLMDVYQLPASLYESEFFSPTYYATGFLLNSPGDLLLTVALIACTIAYLHTLITVGISNRTISIRSAWVFILIFLATFLFSVVINFLLSGLITNSQISFNINNVFELTGYSLAGLMVIGLLSTSLYLMCDTGVSFIRRLHPGFGLSTILFLVSQGLFLAILLSSRNYELFKDYGFSAFLLANVLILFITYVRNNEKRLFSFSRTVLVIVAFSLYAAELIYNFNQTKEHGKRQAIAVKLINEQDIVAEYLLQEIEQKIAVDYNLIHLFHTPTAAVISNPQLLDDVSNGMIRQYFNGYMGRYDVHFKFFDSNDIPVNRAGDPTWNLEEYTKIIATQAKPTNCEFFHYIQGETGRKEYIGKINIHAGDEFVGQVIVELTARTSQEESGLPDLLMSDQVGATKEPGNYSYARYIDGKLVSQHGTYNYYLTSAPYEEYIARSKKEPFATFDQYSHLFYQFGNNGLLIVSASQQGFTEYVTLFSYLFTLFSLAFLSLFLLSRFVRNGFHLEINFKSRIQLTIVAIVAVILILIGSATVTYILNNYEQAQDARLQEKINNLRVLVQNELGNRASLGNALSDDLNYAFNKLCNTLHVDFNIYSLTGQLLFTSQPRIYEQELVAPLMNRDAWQRLTANQRAIYVQHENVSRLRYKSAYEPVRNSDEKIIGYINLPYFARESDLKHDISIFLAALINIYVFLFSFAVLAAFIISNRITLPLRIIQEGLKRTKLGKSTEPLQWKTKDEIGALINEYNRMVSELQQSAELLAQSERESAWREMAKQVAHEIKNPLTPMKLGVQHLQRSMADNHPNKEQMVQKICATLVEQIDTLSNIATAFSNFAQMPGAAYTRVELNPLLEHTSDLYNEPDSVVVQYAPCAETLAVMGDKDQLLRILSNLVKNAVQAIPETRKGTVTLQLERSENRVLVHVSDNGDGIPKNQINNIFVPNFTTKSSGTGLGLAMVRNMTEGMQGKVWFETEEGKGTVFHLSFPLA